MEFIFILGLLGAGMGVVVVILGHTFRPVLVALFSSPEKFRDEYGTPEEQGRIGSIVTDKIAARVTPAVDPQRPAPRHERQGHIRPGSDPPRPSEGR